MNGRGWWGETQMQRNRRLRNTWQKLADVGGDELFSKQFCLETVQKIDLLREELIREGTGDNKVTRCTI